MESNHRAEEAVRGRGAVRRPAVRRRRVRPAGRPSRESSSLTLRGAVAPQRRAAARLPRAASDPRRPAHRAHTAKAD